MDILLIIIRKKLLLFAVATICYSQVTFAQSNQTTMQHKTAQQEILRETNREELLRISNQLESKSAERKRNVEDFAKRNNIEIRRELPNGKVIQLIDIENGQPWFYTTHNTGAAQTTRANQLWTGGNLGLTLDGSSLPPIGVWDAGAVLSNHQEFTNGGNSRITQKDNATSVSTHATHVSGTIAASGINSRAKGMAHNTKIHAYDWSNDAAEMAAAAADGMLISNHSYGYTYGWSGSNWFGNPNISNQEDYRFGFYSTYSRNWDNIAYNAPYYLIVKSAGNDRNEGPVDGAYPKDGYPDGFDCIGTDAIGKNILTVGNVSQVSNYTKPSDVVMSSNSGWGPVDDGRIKPDVVGKGVMVYSTSGSSVTGYATMSGTSMASPNVAGTIALLQEYYMKLNGKFMRSATLKALTIHTTDEAGPSPGPDYMFGWGLVNAERAAQLISANQSEKILIQEQTLANNGSYQLEVYSDGSQPLKATIVWTDPAGKALSASLDPLTPALVNDLDLQISGNNSNFYPWKLDRDNPSAPATRNSKNFVDNVEVVLIDNPAPGTYTIKVTHDGTLSADQAFSIIISGVNKNSVTAPIADFSADKTSINIGEFVQFNNLSTNNATSYKWEFTGAEITASSETNPKVKFITEGTFTVKLTATNSAGSNTKTKTGYISVKAASLKAEFTASATTVIEGGSVIFTDQSLNNPTSWSWTFQGGTPSSSSAQNPSVSYGKAGVYDVTLLISNANGTNQITKSGYISVNMKAPIAGFTADKTEIFVGESVQFADQSQNALSYAWTFEGGIPATSTAKNPLVQYNSAGTFTVTQKVTNSSGSETKIQTGMITVKAEAVKAEFTASTTKVVEGGSILFTDKSLNNPTKWSWTFHGGTPSTSSAQNPSISYNTAGVYNVKLVAENSSGVSEILKEGYIVVEQNNEISYTAANSMNSNNEWINSISIGNFSNRNSGPSTYSDFTNHRIMLNEGTSYSISLAPGYSGAKNPVNWKIWIDYNNDKDFDDPGEEIFSATNSRNNANGKITIPRGVGPLVTRMRIAMSFGEIPKSSGTFLRGEVEDYTVEISPSASSKSDQQELSMEIPGLNVYPNPVTDKLFIQLNNWEPNCMVRLTDLSGRIVYNRTSTDNIKMIDVSDLNKGLYILTVTDGKNIDSHKVTVQ